MEVADEAVAEGTQRLVVQVAGGAPPVVELTASRARVQRAQRPLVGGVGERPLRMKRAFTVRWRPDALTGPIPLELGNLARLRVLDLALSELTGAIPHYLARIHRSKLEGAGCRAGGEFGGCAGVRRAVPEPGAVAQRRSGALRARELGSARRARACWREPGSGAGAVSGRQAGSGIARSRASAAASCPAQGQRLGRCRVQRRAEWVSRPARAK